MQLCFFWFSGSSNLVVLAFRVELRSPVQPWLAGLQLELIFNGELRWTLLLSPVMLTPRVKILGPLLLAGPTEASAHRLDSDPRHLHSPSRISFGAPPSSCPWPKPQEEKLHPWSPNQRSSTQTRERNKMGKTRPNETDPTQIYTRGRRMTLSLLPPATRPPGMGSAVRERELL